MSKDSPKIGLVSLGCAKNLVDAQRLTSVLIAMGYKIENEYSKCDVVVVNTCGFIGPAVEESMQAIGEALNYSRKVIVTGCLGARAKVIMDKYPQNSDLIRQINSDDVLNLIQSRRSIRNYKQENVSKDTIQKLKDMLNYVPTGKNNHALHFSFIDLRTNSPM